MHGRDNVIVIGATNRRDAIDQALRRPGRFDRELEIGVPDKEGRREIVDIHTRGMPISDDFEIEWVLENTYGFVGADINALVREAAMKALRRYLPEIDLDDAANDVRERVARVVDNLPSESSPPQILKQAAGFTTTLWISLSSKTWSDLELGDYVDRYLIDQFSSIRNVGRVRTGGLRELSVRVWIDPIKLAANNLTVQEVEQAVRNENISLPSGSLESANIDLTLNLDKSYNDLEKLKPVSYTHLTLPTKA